MSIPPPPPPLPPHPEIRYHPYEYGASPPAPSQYHGSPAPPSPYNAPYNPYGGGQPPASYSSGGLGPNVYNSPPPSSYNAAPPPQADYRVTSPMPAPRPQGPAIPLLNTPPPPQQPAMASQSYGGMSGFAGGFALSSSHGNVAGAGGEDVMASIRRVGSMTGGYAQPQQPPAGLQPAASSDTAPPLPTVKDLTAASPSTPAGQMAWCRDAVFLIERGTPHAQSLQNRANSLLSSLAVSNPEAVYLRACISASANPRQAFRDFEASARAGCHMAWFRLGRDYEQFGDNQHAKECFERGVRVGVNSCSYRMGMAYLLGQLDVNQDPVKAMDLLKRAAAGATMYTPEPAYVYALLLMSEFTAPAPHTLPQVPLPPNPLLTAKPYLVKAAQLHFPPAQYKLAHAHEFATYPFSYDALLSVEYYSKASQAGEREADMALSKWFLCGAEGAFERDESLARVFAERAAGELASAMFAMGYYDEVGVGGPVDLVKARVWYTKAYEQGNADAGERLKALKHERVMGDTLVRTRTKARMKAHNGPQQPQGPGRDVVGMLRKNTLEMTPPMPSLPQQPMPPMAHQPMPPMQHTMSPIPQQPMPPMASQPVQQQMPGRNRYSLTDPGAGAPRPHSQSPSRPQAGRMPSGQVPQVSPRPPAAGGSPGSSHAKLPSGAPNSRPSTAASNPSGRIPAGVMNTPQPAGSGPPKRPGPTTFAEMGFQGGKAEEEKCTVM
ncbi:HCP-like protein [Hymenopellis radicata]|nr:HCP-like protein [Hymenopellis radicata]